MIIDPEREITLTIPFGMIEKLTRIKPILSMFRDEEDVRSAMEIIEAIHTGAVEFIRKEEGDLMDYLTKGDEIDQILESMDDDDDKDDD